MRLNYVLDYKWRVLIKLSRSALVVCISNWPKLVFQSKYIGEINGYAAHTVTPQI
jgi:hypothetical protein